MAELRSEVPAVTAVLASEAACDSLTPPPGTRLLRIAPREALVVGPADPVEIRAGTAEPTALVQDVSDGWIAVVIHGDDAAEAFCRLSELPTPSDWAQGQVAGVSAKVIAGDGGLTILVPAHLAVHVQERIRIDASEVLG